MSIRRLSFYLSLAFLAVVLIGLPTKSQFRETQTNETETELIAGRNVNMVSGTTLPGGDPWLQRQNEPSIAVSTRNPLHLLAGANDYRTVDIPFSEGELPGKAQGAMAGDAWLGVFKSFDGGESWITSLIPGFPQDNSPEGMASPLKQFSTAADPIVRAGTNGLFYYSGMAFNRAQAKGGGSIFITRFIDNNNVEGGDSIKYLDTKIIDQGTSGQFIDMPRIAVDIPRGSGTVTIDGQSIPRSNVYAVYTVFLGNTDVNIRSRIMFRRSTDCGATWGSAIKISESQHIIQGATIAIDPNSGAVYVAFRRFLHPSQTNAIVIVKSTDFGQTFSKPTVIAEINPFDQPATDAGGNDISDPAGPSFRTNSYPTMTVDDKGIVYVAWTERGWGPSGEARIVMSTSQGGSGWSARWPVVNMADQDGFQGHQFMPSLTFAQGKLVLVWYDQRFDEYGTAYGHGNWIGDGMSIRHTTDVRCAQAEPGLMPAFQPSIQVSKYLWALKPGSDTELEQEQFNPPNFEMFKGGTTPFHGDYIEVAPAPQFVLGPNGWKFNTEPSSTPVFHAVWTDNRDVRPPADGDWTKYTPPSSDQPGFGSVECSSTSPSTMGMRNQNIYTSRLIQGVMAASPGNSKTLGDLGSYYDPENGLIPRAFVVYVQNPGGDIKTFRLTIVDSDEDGANPIVDGSFEEFENLEELDVMIAPYSTIARTVFVRSSDEEASVRVDVVEIDGLGGQPVPGGLTASVVLNPDPTSPGYSPSDEIHNPNIRNPNIVNWDELNPNIVNPNIVNPNIVNPNIVNPNIVNPNIRNPNIVNPNIRNPNIVNPNIVNPNIRNYTVSDFDGAQVSDVVFEIKNEGNTTSTYTLKTYSKESLPDAVYAQLLVYRVHYTPSGDYYSQTDPDCELRVERHHELLLNVTNPNIRNPNIVNPNIRNPNIRNGGLDNATFAVPPGEEVEAILRIIDFAPGTTQGVFRIMTTGQRFSTKSFAESIGFAVTSHAYNTDDARTKPEEELTYPAIATKLIISTTALPDGVVGSLYSATLWADGGTAPYYWALNAGELPPGLSLGTGGSIVGTPTASGLYNFVVRVDDSASDFDTQEFSIYIDSDGTPNTLTITTTTLPNGVLNYWYGATLEATGGVWPRTWSLTGGSLPPGVSLDSSGVISGKILQEEGQDYPTRYSFTVQVKDRMGATATKAFTIDVNVNTGEYFTISGTVYDEAGYPLGGVVMRGLPNTPVTNATGYYSDDVPEGWSGTVEPFKAGHSFNPPSRTYDVITENMTGQNYNEPSVAAWAKTYGGTGYDGATSIQYTSDGGYIVSGGTSSFGVYDNGWVLKLDDAGDVIWQKTYGGASGDRTYYIQQTSDGRYIAVGETASFGAGSSDLWVLKLDDAGNVEWQKTYGGSALDAGYRIQQTSDGGYIVAGVAGSFGAGSLDFWVLKLDGVGNVEWQKTYGGPGYEFMHSFQQTSDGGYIAAGQTLSFGAGLSDLWVLKLDDAGNVEWQKTYGGSAIDVAYSFQQTSDGGYMVVGHTSSFGAGDFDLWVLKLDSAGDVVWQKTYGGSAGDYGWYIKRTFDSGYIVVGTTYSFGAGDSDLWVLKLDSAGDVVWQKTYGGPTREYWHTNIQQRSDGSYLVAGHTYSFGAGSADLWVLKLRPDGSIGTSCPSGIGAESSAIIGSTSVTPSVSTATVKVSAATITDVTITPADTSATVQTQCQSDYGTYIISGTVRIEGSGLEGVEMSGLPGNPKTNSYGFYSGTVNYGWSGTVTPSLDGYTFSPPSRSYTNVAADQKDQNYTATGITYRISGWVKIAERIGLGDVVMSGLPGNPVTNPLGYYTATVPYGWSGTVTPTKTGYAFTPPSYTYSSVTDDQVTNYSAAETPGVLLDHFEFNTIDTQVIGIPFDITITAKDAYGNTVTSYTGTNTLTLIPLGTISPSSTGAFSAGVWTGSVTISGVVAGTYSITTTGDSKTGNSNMFRVVSPLDTTPPTVTNLSPANNSTNVAWDTVLTVTFDENVKKASGAIVIKKSANDAVFQMIDVTSPLVTVNSNIVTISHDVFGVAADYYIQIAATCFEDLAGNPYAGIADKTTWHFSTASVGGLVALFPFNGNYLDASGNGNHGDPHGGPEFTTDRFGNPNGAIRLDGVDDYVSLMNESNFDLTTFTIVAIVEVPDYSQDNDIISKGPEYGNYTIEIGGPGYFPGWVYYIHQVSEGNWSTLAYNQPVPTNVFFHIAVTMISSPSSYFQSYFNGQKWLSTSGFLPPQLNDSAVTIGREIGITAPAKYFKGIIDEIQIYNRALTETEVKALYNTDR